MSFWIAHRYRGDERDPSLDLLSALYDELQTEDEEHPSVALCHESEWCLSVYRGGLLIWENVEDPDIEPRHIDAVSKEHTIALWIKLSQGDIAAIDQEPWLPVYD